VDKRRGRAVESLGGTLCCHERRSSLVQPNSIKIFHEPASNPFPFLNHHKAQELELAEAKAKAEQESAAIALQKTKADEIKAKADEDAR
jgi:hypothetical protein